MNDLHGFRQVQDAERQRMLDRDSPYTFGAALNAENRAKNRYQDINPFDWNRVKLSVSPDYINASFVNNGHRNWIATQGPISDTLADFWEMVMEYSSTVVMLCGVKERGIRKCARYWPAQPQTSMEIVDKVRNQTQIVTCKSMRVDEVSGATIRNIHVQCIKGGDKQRVKTTNHVHFETWPDYDITTTESVLALLKLCIELHDKVSDKEEPIIVHCSAGCGRTGTFIALHALQQDPSTDLVSLVDHLRKQRVASVQAEAQFDLLAAFQDNAAKT